MTNTELVRRVAIEVMGYEIDSNEPWLFNQLFVSESGIQPFWGFDPLTNANHTEKVVATMGNKGFNFIRIYNGNTKDNMCAFFKGNLYKETEWIYHKNLGHATCLAALREVT